MNKHAEQIKDALKWESDRGFGPKVLQESKDHVTLADGTQVSLKGGRIEVKRTEAVERELQESIKDLHEQQPTSYVKQPQPQPDPIEEDASFLGLDLSAYKHYKSPAPKPPVFVSSTPTGTKTLSEAQLDEARASLYGSAAGLATHKALPEGIHQKLYRAIAG